MELEDDFTHAIAMSKCSNDVINDMPAARLWVFIKSPVPYDNRQGWPNVQDLPRRSSARADQF